jgi:hypothetical protein
MELYVAVNLSVYTRQREPIYDQNAAKPFNTTVQLKLDDDTCKEKPTIVAARQSKIDDVNNTTQ